MDNVLFEDVLLCREEVEEFRFMAADLSAEDFLCWFIEDVDLEGTEAVCDEGSCGGRGDGMIQQWPLMNITLFCINPASIMSIEM